MKRIILASLLICLLCFTACSSDYKHVLNAIQSFSVEDTLSNVDSAPCDVVILLGQSNATGVAANAYLEQKAPDEYAALINGSDNVLINYITENGGNSSENKFVKVVPGQGANKDYFGPELGIADALSKRATKQVFILKYAWGGSILDTQWFEGNCKRGELYDAAMAFVTASLDYLKSKGYKINISAVCWMQGESDSFDDTMTKRYHKNTTKFVEYLRKDLSKYSKNKFIFIDAGIAEIDLWKNHKDVNAAKKQCSEELDNYVYFSTQEMGLTTNLEPEGGPDIAHYDSLSALALGRKFAEYIVLS